MNTGALLQRLGPLGTAVQGGWASLAVRDRRLLAFAGSVLAMYLLWALAVAPAWHTLSAAPAQREALDAQWQQMQALAAEVQTLRNVAPVAAEQAQAALGAATTRLGEQGKLSLQGQRAVLRVKGISGAQLRSWLAEARVGARARVVEATLTQAGAGVYDGMLTVAVGGPQ